MSEQLALSTVTVRNILTRTTGYLRTVTSHSLQPYRGCTYGRALCGVGCYVRHNGHVTQGRPWGSFLEVRTNAADSYTENFAREARWARRQRGEFSIFCSSSTDPFVPQEAKFGVMHGLLSAMLQHPPDLLVVQTHSHLVTRESTQLQQLAARCRVRVQVSIETDYERLPGLPPPASSVERRLMACAALRQSGLWTVVTVAPLLPIRDPHGFFRRIGAAANAVVLDHFVGGDGSTDGSRTLRTPLPLAIEAVDPSALEPDYRDQMEHVARQYVTHVGVHCDGFAGRYRWTSGANLPSTTEVFP